MWSAKLAWHAYHKSGNWLFMMPSPWKVHKQQPGPGKWSHSSLARERCSHSSLARGRRSHSSLARRRRSHSSLARGSRSALIARVIMLTVNNFNWSGSGQRFYETILEYRPTSVRLLWFCAFETKWICYEHRDVMSKKLVWYWAVTSCVWLTHTLVSSALLSWESLCFRLYSTATHSYV